VSRPENRSEGETGADRFAFITWRFECGCLAASAAVAAVGMVMGDCWLTLVGGLCAGFFTCASLYTWATRP